MDVLDHPAVVEEEAGKHDRDNRQQQQNRQHGHKGDPGPGGDHNDAERALGQLVAGIYQRLGMTVLSASGKGAELAFRQGRIGVVIKVAAV